VTRCWASLWSPAALAYRSRRGIAADDAAMAVVVQALVPADESAVVFTRHPVTHRDDQVVVTATRGLGDAMVAGTVTPDTYVLDKASRSTVEMEPGEDPRGPSLDAGTLAALVELALEVESRFGAAVDIEAARAAGRWYLLQARPITTGLAAPSEVAR
jgi:pyruvate,water dikinase